MITTWMWYWPNLELDSFLLQPREKDLERPSWFYFWFAASKIMSRAG